MTQLGNSSETILMKICPKISQTLTICGAKTNPKPCHFRYVFLLRALSRLFRQILDSKIKLSNSDLYKFCVKKLFIESSTLPHTYYITPKKIQHGRTVF